MASDPTAEFLSGFHQCGLLTAAQLADLSRWVAATTADPNAIAREVLQRGWLTPHQVKEVYRGRGKELVVGPYILLDLIGEGGMGRVFRARHTRLDRDVALKVIRQEKLANPMTVRRFYQEIQAVAQLSHPNVVLAFDADEVAGKHYFAMEFIDGTDLTKLVRARGPLPVAEACEYIRQAALGLQHAHERGLVHRDIKPSNLLAAKGGQVKVLDLGLALLNEAIASDGENRMTQDGFVIGTPDFVAPEQAKNPHGVDTRADIYALGATLFYILTGKVPYDCPTATEKLIRHVSDPPPRLLDHRPDAPPQLDALIQWFMAKRPEDRPQTPVQMALALAPFAAPRGGEETAGLRPPLAADDAHRSSQLFRLPAADLARRREQDMRTVNWRGYAVAFLAAVAAAVAGFVVYKAAFAPALHLPDQFVSEAGGLRMIRLDGGTFPMGAADDDPGRSPDEGPVAEVALAGPFYVSATEVTAGQFQAILRRQPAAAIHKVKGKLAAEMPVESVTWDDAVEFCKKLTENDRPKRTGWAYRLPTEAEWEYAARGGTRTPFPFGDTLTPEHATFTPAVEDPPAGDIVPKPRDVPAKAGSGEANPFGLFDVCGNVAEWCADYYARGYPDGPRTNPTGPPSGTQRVVRGGSFADNANRCRVAARMGMLADEKRPTVGFRVVYAATPGHN